MKIDLQWMTGCLPGWYLFHACLSCFEQRSVPVISSPSSTNSSSSSTVPVNNKVPSTPTKLFQG